VHWANRLSSRKRRSATRWSRAYPIPCAIGVEHPPSFLIAPLEEGIDDRGRACLPPEGAPRARRRRLQLTETFYRTRALLLHAEIPPLNALSALRRSPVKGDSKMPHRSARMRV
jgi:hypothetical protein